MLDHESLRFPCLSSRKSSVDRANGHGPIVVEGEDSLSRALGAVSRVHVPGFVIARDDNKPPPSGFD